MKTADKAVVAAAVVVSTAALLGGAFDPLPRLFVGGFLVVVVGVLIGLRQTRLTGDEWTAFAVIAWGVMSAVASRGAPLAAREEITVWVVALCLWIAARRVGAAARQWALAVILGATVMLVFGVVFEAVGMRGVRVGGFLESPNLTASLVVVGLPVLLVLSGTLGPRRRLTRHLDWGAFSGGEEDNVAVGQVSRVEVVVSTVCELANARAVEVHRIKIRCH